MLEFQSEFQRTNERMNDYFTVIWTKNLLQLYKCKINAVRSFFMKTSSIFNSPFVDE